MRSSTIVIAIAANTPITPVSDDHRRRPADSRPFAQCVDEQRQPEPDSTNPARSKRPDVGWRCSLRYATPNTSATDPDRDVDVEDPPPADVGDDEPAEHRPERRRGQRRDHDQRRRPRPFCGREGAEQHRQPDRRQHPAADALDDTEGDQLLDRLRRAAQRRAADEHATKANRKVRFVPKRSPSQPRGRDPHGQAERVAEHDPLGVLRCNSRPSVGSATLTMVVSRMSRNSADTYTTATTHLYSIAGRTPARRRGSTRLRAATSSLDRRVTCRTVLRSCSGDQLPTTSGDGGGLRPDGRMPWVALDSRQPASWFPIAGLLRQAARPTCRHLTQPSRLPPGLGCITVAGRLIGALGPWGCARSCSRYPSPRPAAATSRLACAVPSNGSARPTSSSARSSPAARVFSLPNWSTSSSSAATRYPPSRSRPSALSSRPTSACRSTSSSLLRPRAAGRRLDRPGARGHACSPANRSSSRCNDRASPGSCARTCVSWPGWRRTSSAASRSPRWPTRRRWSSCSPRPSSRSSTSAWKPPT